MPEPQCPILAAAAERPLVVFVGAGVSMVPPTCLPSWWDVNERVVAALAQRVEAVVGPDRAAKAAAAIRSRQRAERFPPEYQAELLARRVGASYFRVLQCLDSDRPNAVHLRLARLAAAGHVAAIVTTNFDRSIEAAFRQVEFPLRTYARRTEFAALAADLHASADVGRAGSCVLLKLHGSAEDPSSLVDTLAQRKRGLPSEALDCLRRLLAANHWVFLGWSGADLDADEGYLGLKAAAEDAPGFTWLYRTNEKPRAAVVRLRESYAQRGAFAHGELPDWFANATAPFLPADPNPCADVDPEVRRQEARERVAIHARDWATSLGTTMCALGLSELLIAVGEPQAALELVRSTRDALPDSDRDGSESVTLAVALAGGLARAGRDTEALELYSQSAETIESRRRFDLAAQVRLNMGTTQLARGDWRTARESFERALDFATRNGDEDTRSVALHNLAMLEGELGNFETSERYFRAEIDILRRLGDEPNTSVALNDLGEMLGRASRYDASETALNEAIRVRKRLGNDRGRAISLGNLARVRADSGKLDAAAAIYEEVISIFVRLGDEPNRVKTIANLALMRLRQGRLAEALPPLRDAVARAEALGRDPSTAHYLANTAEALLEAGQFAEARAAAEKSVAIWERLGLAPGKAEALGLLGRALSELGAKDEARGVLQQAVDLRESLGDERGATRGRIALGLIAQSRGDLEAASSIFEHCCKVAARLGDDDSLQAAKHNLGNIAYQQRRLPAAVEAYKEAAECADRLGRPLLASRSRGAMAFALGLQGAMGAALAAFREAEASLPKPSTPASVEPLIRWLDELAQIYGSQGYANEAATWAAHASRLRDAVNHATVHVELATVPRRRRTSPR